MKRVILTAAIVATIIFTACKSETKNADEANQVSVETVESTDVATASFGVRGNCSMCKATIEKAANGVEGVAKAEWDVNKKKIDVSFDADKTNADAIKNAIAASGYDAEGVMGNEEAYKNLPGCCQYDHNMEMNQDGSKKAETH